MRKTLLNYFYLFCQRRAESTTFAPGSKSQIWYFRPVVVIAKNSNIYSEVQPRFLLSVGLGSTYDYWPSRILPNPHSNAKIR